TLTDQFFLVLGDCDEGDFRTSVHRSSLETTLTEPTAARHKHGHGKRAGTPQSEKAATSARRGARWTRLETRAERNSSRCLFHLLHHPRGDRVERRGYRMTRVACDQRVGPVAPLA